MRTHSPGVAAVLQVLRESRKPIMTYAEIAAVRGVTAQHVGNIVSELVQQGHVDRLSWPGADGTRKVCFAVERKEEAIDAAIAEGMPEPAGRPSQHKALSRCQAEKLPVEVPGFARLGVGRYLSA